MASFQNPFVVKYLNSDDHSHPRGSGGFLDLFKIAARKMHERLRMAMRCLMGALRVAMTKPEYLIDMALIMYWASNN